MNIFSVAVKGGVVMIPILLCSLVAVYVVIERMLVLRSAQIDVGQFVIKVKETFRRRDIAGVEELCQRTTAPIAAIIQRGIDKISIGELKVKEAIENAGREEIYRLEKRLSWLASIAGIAPMLGFLGTVTGMIAAFQQVESQGASVNPATLAGGIWEALITTAFGLIVGIPAYAAYNYFVSRVEHFVHEMEMTTTQFLDLLDTPSVEEKKLSLPKTPNLFSTPQATTQKVPKRSFGDEEYFEG